MHKLPRRNFLAGMVGLPGIVSGMSGYHGKPGYPRLAERLKTSLNAYSFNAPLTDGSMSLEDLLVFCSEQGFDAVDITGYYFKGYPQVPDDDYLFRIKRKAFAFGLEISGTGVRNDFTIADPTRRAKEVKLVKDWVDVAAKIGAPVIRIFAGTQKNEGISREKITAWMLEDIRSCVEYGKKQGVIIGLQNHNDFIQTAEQVNQIIEAIDSPWFGLILDTGSYRIHDPYEEISRSVKHAVNWQIKENIFINGKEVETDLVKLMGIIKASDYKGYLPIETLGSGDPRVKVPVLLGKLKKTMNPGR